MKLTPAISIIIPAYNCAKYIINTLDSIRNQAFKNYEIIVVNDGSNDNTSEVILEYIKRHNLNIKFIEQQNAGVSVARNKGIENSSGKYIIFIDADDVVHWQYLQILYSVVENENVDTAYCSYLRDVNKILINDNKIENYKYSTLTNFLLLNDFLFNKHVSAFWCYIYKTEIINKYSIRFTKGIKFGEDREFTWKYLAHCTSGVPIELQLYGYRDNPDSTVKNVNWEKTHLLDAVKRVGQYLRENNNEFVDIFERYCYARTFWAVLRTYAQAENRELFFRVINTFNGKAQFKKLLYFPDVRIKITAILFLMHPLFFYYFIVMLKL